MPQFIAPVSETENVLYTEDGRIFFDLFELTTGIHEGVHVQSDAGMLTEEVYAYGHAVVSSLATVGEELQGDLEARVAMGLTFGYDM